MTRCTICNGELEVVSADAVAGRVPERVLELRDEFFVCPRCGKIYWKGTHWDHIERALDRALGATADSSPR